MNFTPIYSQLSILQENAREQKKRNYNFDFNIETMQSVPIKQLDSENMKRKNYQINRINSSSCDKQKKTQKKPWNIEEDRKVIELIEKYGPQRWNFIAENIPGRVGKQCRERWHNHLNPNVNKTAWDEEQEFLLYLCHQSLGNRWADIAKIIDGKTDNSIKNHWNSGMKKKIKEFNHKINELRQNVEQIKEYSEKIQKMFQEVICMSQDQILEKQNCAFQNKRVRKNDQQIEKKMKNILQDLQIQQPPQNNQIVVDEIKSTPEFKQMEEYDVDQNQKQFQKILFKQNESNNFYQNQENLQKNSEFLSPKKHDDKHYFDNLTPIRYNQEQHFMMLNQTPILNSNFQSPRHPFQIVGSPRLHFQPYQSPKQSFQQFLSPNKTFQPYQSPKQNFQKSPYLTLKDSNQSPNQINSTILNQTQSPNKQSIQASPKIVKCQQIQQQQKVNFTTPEVVKNRNIFINQKDKTYDSDTQINSHENTENSLNVSVKSQLFQFAFSKDKQNLQYERFLNLNSSPSSEYDLVLAKFHNNQDNNQLKKEF